MGLVSVRQAGIGITSEGRMFLESLGMRTFEMDAGRYVIGEHSQGILVSGASEKVFNGIDQRDAGIRAGGWLYDMGRDKWGDHNASRLEFG